ncbi:MAG: sulfatase [Planctomycetales bacterium]|nr:sulfatase [Planctomycetales bacterium]
MSFVDLLGRTFAAIRQTALVIVCVASLNWVATAPSLGSELPTTSGMNVLMINIEDCRADVWGCFGNPICRTPNIDRLAQTGIIFDRAYCQYVCCNPSRSSFLTGLRPHSTGVLSNNHNSRECLPPGTRSLPQLVKQRGLYTANIGKLFHSGGSWNVEDMQAFDRIEFQNRPPQWAGPGPVLSFPDLPPPKEPAPKPDDPGYGAWRQSRSNRYGSSGLTDDQEADGRYARTAVALLHEFAKDGRQFFLTLGSSRPHTPLICPQNYIELYDPNEIPMPAAPRRDDQGVPDIAVRFGRPADIWNAGKTPSPAEVRATIAAYYACVSFLDTQLGLVLDALAETGLDRNTIVIFFSDHGFHLGEHDHWSKYTLFELSTRVPMIVRIPGNPANGRRCDEIVELVDLVPTIGELLNFDTAGNLEGISFAPLLVDPTTAWKLAAFSVFGNKGEYNSVRTKRYRYTEWQYQGDTIRELYDLADDPWETVNLADRLEQATRQTELSQLLGEGWTAALPK